MDGQTGGWMHGCDFLWALGRGGAERISAWVDVSKSGQQAQYLSTFVSSAACESLLGTSRKIPPCVEVEKKMWLWKYPNSKHTPSHMQLYLRQADVSSAAPPPPEMTAALISGTPSHGGVSRDWWGSSVSRPGLFPGCSQHRQPEQGRQAGRQAGRLSDTCGGIKIHGREITGEQRSDRLNVSAQLLRALETCGRRHSLF